MNKIRRRYEACLEGMEPVRRAKVLERVDREAGAAPAGAGGKARDKAGGLELAEDKDKTRGKDRVLDLAPGRVVEEVFHRKANPVTLSRF